MQVIFCAHCEAELGEPFYYMFREKYYCKDCAKKFGMKKGEAFVKEIKNQSQNTMNREARDKELNAMTKPQVIELLLETEKRLSGRIIVDMSEWDRLSKLEQDMEAQHEVMISYKERNDKLFDTVLRLIDKIAPDKSEDHEVA